MAMWDRDALWLKAKTFIDKANALEHGDPDFGLWSALALELLCRAALSHIHPALNADPKDERNLFYGLGLPLVEQPRSLPAHSVYLRLEKLSPGFGKSQREFCDYMALQRNVEVHTGDLAFSRIDSGAWLPRFYSVCGLLCDSMGKTLKDFFGDDVGGSAEQVVAAFANAQEATVKKKISEHRKDFGSKPEEERARLALESELRSSIVRLGAIQRECPACGSTGLLTGELIKELEPVYEEGELLVDQEYLANEFQCFACGLHLRTLDEVALAGLGLRFTERTSTNLHERFQAEWHDDYENM